MKIIMIMMYLIILAITIISGCAHTGKAPGSECMENCYYARLDCIESCQSNTAHVTYGWKKTGKGFTSGIVNCTGQCEAQYEKCMGVCKNE